MECIGIKTRPKLNDLKGSQICLRWETTQKRRNTPPYVISSGFHRSHSDKYPVLRKVLKYANIETIRKKEGKNMNGTIESQVVESLDNPYRKSTGFTFTNLRDAVPDKITSEQIVNAVERLVRKGVVYRSEGIMGLAMHKYDAIRAGLVGWVTV